MKITLSHRTAPRSTGISDQLQWFGETLGFFTPRDKDKSYFRVFIEIIRATKERVPISSEELANRLRLSRPTVVHHLKRLLEAGIIREHKRRYSLRTQNLQHLIDELERDTKRIFEDLKDSARKLDSLLGL
jgi:DNA-binding transcriptional ArsR family regulator